MCLFFCYVRMTNTFKIKRIIIISDLDEILYSSWCLAKYQLVHGTWSKCDVVRWDTFLTLIKNDIKHILQI